MPRILDLKEWTIGRLREAAIRLPDGWVQMAEFFDHLPSPMAHPWALESGLRRVRRSAELATDILDTADSSSDRLARPVNQLREVGNSMPGFLRFAEAPPPAYPSRGSKPA
jgi:hypothetical protein